MNSMERSFRPHPSLNVAANNLLSLSNSLLINPEENSFDECQTNRNFHDEINSNNISLLCCVCQDRASGRHYGVLSCEVRFRSNRDLFNQFILLFRVVKDFSNEVFENRCFIIVSVTKIVQSTNLCEIGKKKNQDAR